MDKMDDFLSNDLENLRLEDFPSARIKIDQLFTQWLSFEGKDLIELLIDKIKPSNKPSPSSSTAPEAVARETITLSNNDVRLSLNLSLTSPISASSLLVPPRSPTKKSPKKRSQSEMLSTNINTVIDLDSAISVLTKSSLKLPQGINIPISSSLRTDGRLSEANSTAIIGSSDSVSILGDDSYQYNKNVKTSTSNVAAAADVAADSSSINQSQVRRRSNFDRIPVFYVPGSSKKTSKACVVPEESRLGYRLADIEASFKPFPNGMPTDKFVHVTKRLCDIPSFFNLPLCQRICERFGNGNSSSTTPIIKLTHFMQFWQQEMEPCDKYERFFRIIKSPDKNYIIKDDFLPFLDELLHFHPGLSFLHQHDDFQSKYALTVITRIFYKVNVSRTGKITLKELRNSNLMEEFLHVDEEQDINRVYEYFSYEHFYILYCKFFELDSDKDTRIYRNDLVKYADHSLSDTIVDRIFQVGYRAFSDRLEEGFMQTGMTLPDFIYFLLAEEDKTNVQSLQYWFKCCDLDGDGRLTPDELRHFYRIQLHRITSLGQEQINFPDVLCQMIDMIDPVDPEAITIDDLTKHDKIGQSGLLFDALFNLHKFIRFETRDPSRDKMLRERESFANDWDRYACYEYEKLSKEDEGYGDSDNYNNTMDIDSNRYLGNSGGGGGRNGAYGWSNEEYDVDDDADTVWNDDWNDNNNSYQYSSNRK